MRKRERRALERRRQLCPECRCARTAIFVGGRVLHARRCWFCSWSALKRLLRGGASTFRAQPGMIAGLLGWKRRRA